MGLTFGFLLVFILGCEREPSPLGPDAILPGPEDQSLFSPETLAVFNKATEKVMALPSPENWAELGRIYHAHEQLDDAIECYQYAIKAGDNSNRTSHLLALALDETGDRSAALDAMRRAAKREPTHSPTYWRLGQWILETGDRSSAETFMRQAYDSAPNDPTTTLAIAKFFLDTDRPEDATRTLVALLKQFPENRYAHYLLGTALSQLGNTFDSRAHLELGKHSKPHWPDKHYNDLIFLRTGPAHEFELLSMASNRGEARQSLPGLLALEPQLSDDVNYYISLTKTYRRLIELDNAQKMLNAGLAISEDSYRLHYQNACLDLDRWNLKGKPLDDPLLDSAFEKVNHAISLNPSDSRSYALRGILLNLMGQYDQSVAAFQKADSLDTTYSSYGYQAAKVYLDQEKWLKAEPLLIELVDRYPYDVPLLRELAMTRYAAEKWPEAQKSLTQYQSTNPNDPEVNAALREIDGS